MDKKASYLKKQSEMGKELRVLDESSSISLREGDQVVTIDVQYENDWGYVGMDCLAWESGSNHMYVSKERVEVEYTPGFFAFREGPIVQQSIEKLIRQEKINPSLLIIDGHGTAHPRSMGVACWVGIIMNIPTIGVAKESLLKISYELDAQAGSVAEIVESDKIIGNVLRTQTGINPLFVSAGHLISQQESLEIIKKLRGKYKIIEPMRRADQAARRYAKGEIKEGEAVFL